MSNIVRPPETWLPLDVDEADFVAFDFTDMLVDGESIASVVITCEAVTGTDATASSRPSGTPVIDAAVVKQLMAGVVEGVTYLIRCKATLAPAPRQLVLAGVVDGVRIQP
jgi:hypothetical protein